MIEVSILGLGLATEADVRSERERKQGHTWIHPTRVQEGTTTTRFCCCLRTFEYAALLSRDPITQE